VTRAPRKRLLRRRLPHDEKVELAPPEVSNQEIERKFLVTAFPSEEVSGRVHVEQGYLAVGLPSTELSEPLSVRLRKVDDRGTFLTVKAGSGLARTEVELELAPAQFEALWPLTKNRRLTKTRLKVPLAGELIAEVDFYEGSLEGLATVEVEFSSNAQAEGFVPPGWFGKEVTGDSQYLNWSLAVYGKPSDS
jgi:adenylate cyclase